MVFNIFVKFYENMSSGFKVMERTRKLLTQREREREIEREEKKDENYIRAVHICISCLSLLVLTILNVRGSTCLTNQSTSNLLHNHSRGVL